MYNYDMIKKFFKRSIIVPVVAGILLIGSSTTALAATGVISLPKKPVQRVVEVPVNPPPKTDNIISQPDGTLSTEDQAKVDHNSEVVKSYTQPNGKQVTIHRSALDENGVYHGPNESGCWNFSMTGANIPAESKSVCGDADIMSFRAEYLARDAAASRPLPTTPPASIPVDPPPTAPVGTEGE